MQKLLLLLCVFLSLNVSAKQQKSFYTESADVFEIMDQVSRWHPAISTTFQRHWVKKFGKLFNDQNYIDDYINLRKKYYKYSITKMGKKNLFTSFDIANNYFSDSFYGSQSIGEALKKLRKKLTKREVGFLAKFYTHFQKKISIFVKESSFFSSQTKSYQKKIQKLKARSVIKKAKRFILDRTKVKNVRVLFVWWPKDQDAQIDIRGRNIIIRIHPEKTEFYPAPETILLYKLRTYLANLSKNTQKNVNTIFFKVCNPIGVTGEEILELPLSIALGDMSILEKKDRKEFNYAKKWSIHPWVNTYAKLLYPEIQLAIKRQDIFSGDFIKNAANLCRELTLIGEYLSSFKHYK